MALEERPRRPWLLGLVVALITGVVVVALVALGTVALGAVAAAHVARTRRSRAGRPIGSGKGDASRA